MKRPTTLYRYNVHHELEKYQVQSEDAPQVVGLDRHARETLWRVQRGGVDVTGFSNLRNARIEERFNLVRDIGALQALLKKLEGQLYAE